MVKASQVVRGAFGSYEIDGDALQVPGNAKLFAIKGSPRELYKHFSSPLRGEHVTRVTDLVQAGREMRGHKAMPPDFHRIAWPHDLVVDCGTVLGVVIPRAGPEFHRNPKTSTLSVPIAQSFQHLAGPGGPPVRDRLFIVRQLAGALGVLERVDFVHGDISASNMLWAIRPRPSLLVIDCDGVHPRGFAGDATFTVHWMDPRLKDGLVPRHDVYSDWYALALAVYRVLVLNYRAAPEPAEFSRSLAHVPSPLVALLKQVFESPHDQAARVPPARWKRELRAVFEDRAACGRIDAASNGAPQTVAGRREAARKSTPAPAPPRPRGRPKQPATPTASPPPPPVRPPSPASPTPPVWQIPTPTPPPSDRASPSPSSPRPRKRRGRRLLALIVLAVAGVFGSHLAIGVPDWPVLDELNPFLTSQQRALVKLLPAQMRRCRGQRLDLPEGGLAAVTCQWDGRNVTTLRFADATTLQAFLDRRAALAQERMSGRTTPGCAQPGTWHVGSSPGRRRGQTIGFVSDDGARFDWTDTATLTYRIGIARDNDLPGMCRWWRGLEE